MSSSSPLPFRRFVHVPSILRARIGALVLRSHWRWVKAVLAGIFLCLALWGGWRTVKARGDAPNGAGVKTVAASGSAKEAARGITMPEAMMAPMASTGTASLITLQGSGAGTFLGDYISDAGGLDTAHHYFIEVPSGASRLAVDIFDADIGLGGSNEASAGRDRARNTNFNTSARYTLYSPSGKQQNTQFTTGDATGPVGSDNAWLTFFDADGETVRDNFATASYANNDGIANWSTDWIETNDDNSATTGLIQITGGELRISDNGNSINSTIEREADLSGAVYSGATLTFDFHTQNVEFGDQISVQVSRNGGSTWHTLETFTGAFGASSRSYDISAYRAANTRIRFITVGGGYNGTDYFFVDNLQVKGTSVEPGHWELRVDMSSAVTTGDDINAFGIRAHDGTSGVGGTEFNIYADSFYAFGVNPPNTGTASRSYSIFPYITSGCSCSKNDFDFDSNSGNVGSISLQSRSGAFTKTYGNTALSSDDTWRRDSFSGWTNDSRSDDYGIWQADLSINSYISSGLQNGNLAGFYLGNFQAAANPPTANPLSNSFRLYLPTDVGAAPFKPYVEQIVIHAGGPNPPVANQTTTAMVSVRVINPSAYSISFSSSNLVTANVPGSGVVYGGTARTSQGTVVSQPAVGGTGDITWNPGTVAAGSTAYLTYLVNVTPTAGGQRLTVTSTPASGNGTRAKFVDETGNSTQTRATYTFGPLCELALTESLITPVSSCSGIIISPASLPNGQVGTFYNQTISAPGGILALTSGSIPTGLTMTGGTLSGTPTASGAFTFTVTATDPVGCTTSQTYSITINPPPNTAPTFTTVSNATREQGASASNTSIAVVNDTEQAENTLIMTVNGQSASGANSVTSNGVTISNLVVAANGNVTADVGTACGATDATFTLRVTDSVGLFNEATLNVTVTNTADHLEFSVPPSSTVAGQSISPAMQVRVLNQNNCVVNSGTNITLAIGTNPSGAGLSGTTTRAAVNGIATFDNLVINKSGNGYTLSASSSGLTSATSIAFDISCPTITLSALPAGLLNTSYSQAITASGGSGTYSYDAPPGDLPPGLTLSSAGLLSGTPTATGTFTFTVTATDTASSCTETRIYQLVIGNPVASGDAIISEFRFRGPDPDGAGPLVSSANEFVEFFNKTNVPLTVSSNDGSAGWALVASDGGVRFIIPNGTVIPAHGYFLAVNSNGYSLSSFAIGDTLLLPDGVTEGSGYTLDIPDSAGIALFKTADPAGFTLVNRLDAVGFDGVTDSLYFEGAGLMPTGGITVDVEHSFYRKMVTGLPQDTNNNYHPTSEALRDFQLVATDPGSLADASLGAPGPHNLLSALDRNGWLTPGLIAPDLSATAVPNRVRNTSLYTDSLSNSGIYPLGTLAIRRSYTNNTGSDVTRLRFRISDITTLPSPVGVADLRAMSSPGATGVANGRGMLVDVVGTQLENPSLQPQGGGYNATLSVDTITLETPLKNGKTINVEWLLGVKQIGSFRFFVNIEGLP